jgi:hypothetical protein
MTPRQNELKEQLFGSQDNQQQSMGALGAIKEAFLAVAPGLKDMIPEAKEQLKHLGNLGRSELASALFGNGAFVLYSHEPENDQAKQQDNSQHLERGGRSM